MKTIVLQEPGSFNYRESQPAGEPARGEALLKVHRIGICGTDLHAYEGIQPFFSYPRILGHELGVEVVAVGEGVEHVTPGDRCAVEPYRYTELSDPAVRRGKTNCARDLSVLGVHEDGGMREYFTFPAKYLHTSQKLGYDQLALVEPLAIGCHAVNRAGVGSDDRVAVVGAGPIGLGTLQFAKAAGARVAVVETNEDRLAFCRDTLGAEGGINPLEGNLEERLRALFDGELPNIVMDATGNKRSMESDFELVEHGGKLVFIGLIQGNITFHDPNFHKRELTLLASRNALGREFRQVIGAIEAGEIETSPWVTHRAGFDEMVGKFDAWLKPESKVIKAMVEL